MSQKRKIKASEIVRDIRAGLTDFELMKKYQLSSKGLKSVMEKLLQAKAITQAEFDWRPAEYDDTVVVDMGEVMKELDE